MKIILNVCLFFLIFNCSAQVERVGDKICMGLLDYRAVRTDKMLCDSLLKKYDNLVTLQEEELHIKDSIINNLKIKTDYKDSLIIYKNTTIKQLSAGEKIDNAFKIKPQFLIGCLTGMIITILLLQ